jgi:hypothetical protein
MYVLISFYYLIIFCLEYVGELITMDEYRYRMKQNQQCKEENYYYLTIDSNRLVKISNVWLIIAVKSEIMDKRG